MIDERSKLGAQLAKLRDDLIAQNNGAIKYDPMIQDLMVGLDKTRILDTDALALFTEKIRAQASASHAIAITALRNELKRDPEGVGYAGKTPQEIQSLLMAERLVYIDVPDAPTQDDRDERLAALIRGEVYAYPVRTRSELLMVKPPPVGVIWRGIPYCRNLPSIDNINEALT